MLKLQGGDRSLRFFLSTEYDFETKTWSSGGRVIPIYAWAESAKHELSFPVLNDRMMFLHNKDFFNTFFIQNSGQCGPYNWKNELNKLKKERVH